ncbi:MAG: hypothetical protein IJ371_04975 [Clostridia bacterium]|nr:hypothetical protein [Clostridia bacterium]
MTSNVFITKLWNKKPELVKNELRKIFKVKDSETLEYDYTSEDGRLVFEQRIDDRRTTYIFVSDYIVNHWGNEADVESAESMKWMDFMVRIFKQKYIQYFDNARQYEIDTFVTEYNETTSNIRRKLYCNILGDNTINK